MYEVKFVTEVHIYKPAEQWRHPDADEGIFGLRDGDISWVRIISSRLVELPFVPTADIRYDFRTPEQDDSLSKFTREVVDHGLSGIAGRLLAINAWFPRNRDPRVTYDVEQGRFTVDYGITNRSDDPQMDRPQAALLMRLMSDTAIDFDWLATCELFDEPQDV